MATTNIFADLATKYQNPWTALEDLANLWETKDPDLDTLAYLCSSHWIIPFKDDRLEIQLPSYKEAEAYKETNTDKFIVSISGTAAVNGSFVHVDPFVFDLQRATDLKDNYFTQFTRAQQNLIIKFVARLLSM